MIGLCVSAGADAACVYRCSLGGHATTCLSELSLSLGNLSPSPLSPPLSPSRLFVGFPCRRFIRSCFRRRAIRSCYSRRRTIRSCSRVAVPSGLAPRRRAIRSRRLIRPRSRVAALRRCFRFPLVPVVKLHLKKRELKILLFFVDFYPDPSLSK